MEETSAGAEHVTADADADADVGGVSGSTTLEVVLSNYRNWNTIKVSSLRDIRSHTDKCRRRLSSAFATLCSVVGAQPHAAADDDDTDDVGDVEGLLRECQLAVDAELLETKAAQSDDDVAMISRLVKLLVRELQRELDDIEKLLSLSDLYKQLKTSMEPWLDDKPDVLVGKLRVAFSSSVALKSKLRHRIADCQDIQEVCHLPRHCSKSVLLLLMLSVDLA